MNVEEVFGKVLKKIRKNRKLSQEQLAFVCNLDRTYISLMERGKRNPTINTIFSLAKGLDIPPSDLILETERTLNILEGKYE